jgi:hypothetical protein
MYSLLWVLAICTSYHDGPCSCLNISALLQSSLRPYLIPNNLLPRAPKSLNDMTADLGPPAIDRDGQLIIGRSSIAFLLSAHFGHEDVVEVT